MKFVPIVVSFVVALAGCGGGGGSNNGGSGGVSQSLCEQACSNQTSVCQEPGVGFGDQSSCVSACMSDDSAAAEQGAQCLSDATSCDDIGRCVADYYEGGGSSNGGDDTCWPNPPSGQEVAYDGSWSLATSSPIPSSDDFSSKYAATAMAIPANEQPVVAVVEKSGDVDSLRVRQWDGSSWIDMNALDSRASVDLYDLVVDGSDRPVVAWVDRGEFGTSDESMLHIQAWSGTQWQELGPLPSFEARKGLDSLDLHVNAQGAMFAAAKFSGYQGDLGVFEYDGATWTAVGNSGLSGNSETSSTSRLHLSTGSDGTLYLSLLAENDPNSVYLEKWDGSSWQQVGSEAVISDDVGDMLLSDISAARVSANGNIYLLVTVTPDPDNVTGRVGLLALQWDGSDWTRLGADRCVTDSMKADVGGEATLETQGGFDLLIDAHGAPIFATGKPLAYRLASDGYFYHLGDTWAFSGRYDGASTSGSGRSLRLSGDTLFGLIREEGSGQHEMGYYVKTYNLAQ